MDVHLINNKCNKNYLQGNFLYEFIIMIHSNYHKKATSKNAAENRSKKKANPTKILQRRILFSSYKL